MPIVAGLSPPPPPTSHLEGSVPLVRPQPYVCKNPVLLLPLLTKQKPPWTPGSLTPYPSFTTRAAKKNQNERVLRSLEKYEALKHELIISYRQGGAICVPPRPVLSHSHSHSPPPTPRCIYQVGKNMLSPQSQNCTGLCFYLFHPCNVYL